MGYAGADTVASGCFTGPDGGSHVRNNRTGSEHDDDDDDDDDGDDGDDTDTSADAAADDDAVHVNHENNNGDG